MRSNHLRLIRRSIARKDIIVRRRVVEVEVRVKRILSLSSRSKLIIDILGGPHNLSIVRSVIPLEGPVHQDKWSVSGSDTKWVSTILDKVAGDSGRDDLVVERKNTTGQSLDRLNSSLEERHHLLHKRSIVLDGHSEHRLAETGSGGGAKLGGDVEEGILAKRVLDQPGLDIGEVLEDGWEWLGLAVDKVGLREIGLAGSGPDVGQDNSRVWIGCVVGVVFGKRINHAWELAVGSDVATVSSPEVATWVGVKLERGDDSEVIATAAEGLVDIWVALLGDIPDSSVGKDNLVGDNVVAGESVLAGEVRHASSNEKSTDTNIPITPTNDADPSSVGYLVDLTPLVSWADSHGLLVGRNLLGVQVAEIDGDSIVDVVGALEWGVATGADSEWALHGAEHEEGHGDIERVGWGDDAEWGVGGSLGSPDAGLPGRKCVGRWTSDLAPEDGGEESALWLRLEHDLCGKLGGKLTADWHLDLSKIALISMAVSSTLSRWPMTAALAAPAKSAREENFIFVKRSKSDWS